MNKYPFFSPLYPDFFSKSSLNSSLVDKCSKVDLLFIVLKQHEYSGEFLMLVLLKILLIIII